MEVGDVDWFTALHEYYLEEQGKSEEEVTDLLTSIAANSKIAKGHTDPGRAALRRPVRGHRLLVQPHHRQGRRQGRAGGVAPASGEPVQPIVVRPNGIALMKTATNPAPRCSSWTWC